MTFKFFLIYKKKPFLVYVDDFATISSVRLNILATTEKNLFPTCMISALALAEKSKKVQHENEESLKLERMKARKVRVMYWL